MTPGFAASNMYAAFSISQVFEPQKIRVPNAVVRLALSDYYRFAKTTQGFPRNNSRRVPWRTTSVLSRADCVPDGHWTIAQCFNIGSRPTTDSISPEGTAEI